MRAYIFSLTQLGHLHKGIQNFHSGARMFAKYSKDPNSALTTMMYDWADNHETAIFMDGGNYASLQNILEFFKRYKEDFPFAYFAEDRDSLNNILTSICIVLPERIYLTALNLREGFVPSAPNSLTGRIEVNGIAISLKDLAMAEFLNKFRTVNA